MALDWHDFTVFDGGTKVTLTWEGEEHTAYIGHLPTDEWVTCVPLPGSTIADPERWQELAEAFLDSPRADDND